MDDVKAIARQRFSDALTGPRSRASGIEPLRVSPVPASIAIAVPAYYQGETQHCPYCTRQQWWIGRSSAECAFCHGALPFAVAA